MAYYADDQAMITKAADLLRLSVRLPEYADKFKAYTAGNPRLASAATQYLARVNGVAAVESAALSKGSSSHYCVECGHTIKSKHPRCKHCGARNKAYIIGRKVRPVMGKKKQAKKMRRATIMKAYRAASGVKTTNRGAAMNAMWRAAADSYDPAERETARKFLGMS